MSQFLKSWAKLSNWQKRFIKQARKEALKDGGDKELVNKARKECIKTNDENFIFAFAVAVNQSFNDRTELVDSLLEIDAGKWAIPIIKEILANFYDKCRDALIDNLEHDKLLELAQDFGHDEKIQDALISHREIDLCLEYAKQIKDSDLNSIGMFVKKYSQSSTFGNEYMSKFEKIYKSKLKSSKKLCSTVSILEQGIEK